MSTLQEEQPAYDRAVCDAMVASAPDTEPPPHLRCVQLDVQPIALDMLDEAR